MATGNRIVIFHISGDAGALAERIRIAQPEAESIRYSTGGVEAHWGNARALIFIMASGIAVRSIAPFLKDKSTDPAVLVIDDKARHVVSLAGGHEAGANALAREIAGAIGATPVITTGTDSNDLTAVDLFARSNGLVIENRNALPSTSSRHIEHGALKVHAESGIALPSDYIATADAAIAEVIISRRVMNHSALMLRPRDIVLGIGLNSGTTSSEIADAVRALFEKEGLSTLSIGLIATHEKKTREPGLKQYARSLGAELMGLTTGELNSVTGVSESKAAMRALGVRAVCEPSALLASGAPGLLVGKVKSGNVTLALSVSARREIYVVGTGPGGMEHITPEALNAIRNSDHIVGFKSYLDLITPLTHGKHIHSSVMTQEVDRVGKAIDLALEGKKTSIVSGGDPGIYAMAGLVYEIARSRNAPLDVRVIPGLSALNACGARLGAPLMHDFCAISLSDRLTPWALIEERLEAAARADFVIVLYNPKSKGRATQIGRAREIVMRHRSASTPVGIVSAAMRPDEDVSVTCLEQMLEHDINMKSTVIIGNSQSFRWRGRLITPRGYGKKYEI